MSKLDIWQETFVVRFGVIDRSDRLTLDAVFQLFQEVAISHADNLGVGREDMARSRQVWILSRMSALIDRRPQYGETLTVRTWPRGGERLFALRDYDIRDASDAPVVRARSGWLIIDMDKRRPLRPQSVMETLPQNGGRDALPSGAAGLEERPGLQKTAARKAAYTDIDYNGHVNNVRYIQWIEDALDPALLEQAGRMRLDINYLNETFPGEMIELRSAPIEDAGNDCAVSAFAFEGCKTGSAAFRAELRLWGDL
ncbi:MAG: acyl-ACP thioesterase [Treponema sp.]|jgi:acyl-ACP thioesterase|nr:acyl-ACP thioesterase [Treponema sp.]